MSAPGAARLVFRDILFYAPNECDEKGTGYSRFSGFLSDKIEFQEKKHRGTSPKMITNPNMKTST